MFSRSYAIRIENKAMHYAVVLETEQMVQNAAWFLRHCPGAVQRPTAIHRGILHFHVDVLRACEPGIEAHRQV